MADPVVIAVITDLHAAREPVGGRRGDFAPYLFERALHRLARFVHPDVVVLAGDILNDGREADAPETAARIASLMKILDAAEWIVLPGNHDAAPDRFYSWFPRPKDDLVVRGVRFMTFLDPERPGYNALRIPQDMLRLASVRSSHAGPLVCIQHVPVFPAGEADCPYRVENADEILDVCRSRPTLLLSGHYHHGFSPVRHGACICTAVPALCEYPFGFQIYRVDGRGEVAVEDHDLAVPDVLRGCPDRHVHSQYAYCADDIEVEKAVEFGRLLGAAGLMFAEHASHLYWPRERIHRGVHMAPGNPASGLRAPRAEAYFRDVAARAPFAVAGLEADVGADGGLVVRRKDRERAALLLGAVHRLPGITSDSPLDEAAELFLRLTEGAVQSGIDVLAHPFRAFRRHGLPTPSRLFAPVVRLLCEWNVAAEINFHTNDPDPRFIEMCLNAGIPLSLGTDAHAIWETADFFAHIRLLRKCGVRDSDLQHVLYAERGIPVPKHTEGAR